MADFRWTGGQIAQKSAKCVHNFAFLATFCLCSSACPHHCCVSSTCMLGCLPQHPDANLGCAWVEGGHAAGPSETPTRAYRARTCGALLRIGRGVPHVRTPLWVTRIGAASQEEDGVQAVGCKLGQHFRDRGWEEIGVRGKSLGMCRAGFPATNRGDGRR